MAGHFKTVNEDDSDNKSDTLSSITQKQLQELLEAEFKSSDFEINSKEKKHFSFWKWFKKNKNESGNSSKNSKEASASAFFLFDKKKDSSTESLDTLFSTQTVRSFAYIPSVNYQPSAPPSTLLDFEAEENLYTNFIHDENASTNLETNKEKKKKRKAPGPPRLNRENSLPSTLERESNYEDEKNDVQTYRRRTLSDSCKDKKLDTYSHVQGKRKAPLPPTVNNSLYPNLQKLNSENQNLHKKKKQAPPPPSEKKNHTKNTEYYKIPTAKSKTNHIHDDKDEIKNDSTLMNSSNAELIGAEEKTLKKDDDLSMSPLSLRSWYKRNPKDLNIGNSNKKDFLKGSEKNKNKNTEKRIFESGNMRKSLLLENNHNKFNIFSKIDKRDDKKKQEKRKSQISILTNISELDKEAAEIIKNKQEKEKKIKEAKDNQIYFQNFSPKIKDKNISEEKEKTGKPIKEGKHKENLTEFKEEKKFLNVSDLKTDEKNNQESKLENVNDNKLQKDNEILYFSDPWVCSKCTLENPGWRVFCEICSSVKPRFLFNTNEKNLLSKGKISDNLNERQKLFSKIEEHQSKIDQNKFNKDKIVLKKNSVTERDFSEFKNSNNEKEMKDFSTIENNKQLNVNSNANVKSQDSNNSQIILSDVIKQDREISKQEKNSYSNTEEENKVEKPQKTIEAYVITKTTILEDIIIKKSDRPSNPSTSTQLNATSNKSNKMKNTFENMPQTSNHENDLKKNSKLQKQKSLSKNCILELDNSPGKNKHELSENFEELIKKLTKPENLLKFKADIKMLAKTNKMDTVAVNESLEKLEEAILNNDYADATVWAKELALMKINCNITKDLTDNFTPENLKIIIDMYVENKESHQGPIQIKVSPTMTLLQLKEKIQQELGIPVNIQRWILGKTLAVDDNKTLESDGVKYDFTPIFLYLIDPDKSLNNFEKNPITQKQNETNKFCLKSLNLKENPVDFEDTQTEINDQKNNENFGSNQEYKKQTQENFELLSKLTNHSKPTEGTKNLFDCKKENFEQNFDKVPKIMTENNVKKRVEIFNKTFEEKQKIKSSQSLNCSGDNLGENKNNDTKSAPCNSKTYVNQKLENHALESSSTKTKEKDEFQNQKIKIKSDNDLHYKKLVELQDSDLVSNVEPFNCTICLMDYLPGQGIILKDCLHTFCRECLIETIQFSEDAEVKCPYIDETYSCTSVLQQREIKGLVPQKVFDLHLAKSVKEAENKIENTFHCKTPDCKGWCIYEDNLNEFLCPVCNYNNCLTCHAIHSGMNCRQYQEKMKNDSETDADAKKTRLVLEEMVAKGEAMSCPKCQIVVMKKWGCDWLKCSMCKTEICWVTRGFRWGPGGKGDTSGGCKCGVKGIKCHPKCNYCH